MTSRQFRFIATGSQRSGTQRGSGPHIPFEKLKKLRQKTGRARVDMAGWCEGAGLTRQETSR